MPGLARRTQADGGGRTDADGGHSLGRKEAKKAPTSLARSPSWLSDNGAAGGFPLQEMGVGLYFTNQTDTVFGGRHGTTLVPDDKNAAPDGAKDVGVDVDCGGDIAVLHYPGSGGIKKL